MPRNRRLVCASVLGFGIMQSAAAFAGPPLAAPSNTTAVAVSESRIDVSWMDTSKKESGFELYRSANGLTGLYTLVVRSAAGATGANDLGLNPSTLYCYKVRALSMQGGRTTYSNFSNAACATTSAAPAQPGAIHVTTATSGFDIDVNGYFVRLDGKTDYPLGTNASVTIAGLAAGDHTLLLGHVASNCSVEGANPRAISVTGGATTDVVVAVSCGAGPTIQITASTTGSNLDADGYGVMVWQRSSGGRILAASAGVPSDGTVRFFGLAPAEYDVEVNGIAANCMQVNTLPPVDLTSSGTVSLALNVACAPISNPPAEICDNGIDDDGDGLIDSADPDCQPLNCFTGEGCPSGFVCNEGGICMSHCDDGHWNGDEGDVDCGGSCTAKCQSGRHCWSSFDCASGICGANDVCQ